MLSEDELSEVLVIGNENLPGLRCSLEHRGVGVKEFLPGLRRRAAGLWQRTPEQPIHLRALRLGESPRGCAHRTNNTTPGGRRKVVRSPAVFDTLRGKKRQPAMYRLPVQFCSPGRTRTSDRVANAILLRSIDRGRCVPSRVICPTWREPRLNRSGSWTSVSGLPHAAVAVSHVPNDERRRSSQHPGMEDSATEDQGSGCADAIFLSSRSRRSSPHRGTQRTLPREETGQPIPGPERPLSLFLSVGFDRLRQSCRCPLATTLARGRTGDCA